jgi:hypothetical protein
VVLAVCALTALVLLLRVLERCRYGIDLTDESFYLAWMRAPDRYPSSVLLFGFVYHPLYLLCAGAVALLRRANVLATFVFALPPCFLALPTSTPRALRAASSVALAAGVLAIFHVWLPAPSYNGLALHALLVAATALLLARPAAGALPALLMGLAGWMAYMAKPTTAAALGFVLVVWAIGAGTVRRRQLLLAGLIAALGVAASALAIDGSLAAHLGRLDRGAALLRLLDAGHTISNLVRWEGIGLGARPFLLALGGAGLVALATIFVSAGRPWVRGGALVASALTALAALAAVVTGWATVDVHPLHGLQLLAAPLGLIAAALALERGRPSPAPAHADAALAVALALFPFVHAFGTSGSYWAGAAKVPFLWLLAALVFVRRRPSFTWPALLPAAAHALGVTAVLLSIALAHPTRQPQALALDTWPDEFGSRGWPIVVAEATGLYLARLREAARGAGFQAGDPMIDLTGHAPGALYALGAHGLGQPWLIGGYAGSPAFARAALDEEPCERLARAWVLIEERGPRRLPAELLLRYGIDVKHDLVSAGTAWTPPGEYPRPYGQRLLKPLRAPEAARAACQEARGRR